MTYNTGNPRKYSHEPVFVFEIGEQFLFRHYFQGRDVFKRMQRYYNQRKYRFEVPPDRFDEVKSFLDDYGYTLVIVEETDTFVVVVKSIPPIQAVFLKTPSHSVVRATIIAF